MTATTDASITATTDASMTVTNDTSTTGSAIASAIIFTSYNSSRIISTSLKYNTNLLNRSIS